MNIFEEIAQKKEMLKQDYLDYSVQEINLERMLLEAQGFVNVLYDYSKNAMRCFWNGYTIFFRNRNELTIITGKII